jgi:hypothetical protein
MRPSRSGSKAPFVGGSTLLSPPTLEDYGSGGMAVHMPPGVLALFVTLEHAELETDEWGLCDTAEGPTNLAEFFGQQTGWRYRSNYFSQGCPSEYSNIIETE